MTNEIRQERLDLLLLCDYRTDIAATVRDHIDALTYHSRHHIRRLSIFGDLPPNLELSRFDGVIIHYSIVACSDAYLSASARQKLGMWPGLKVVFIQDEYRHVNRTIAALKEIGVHVIFTCVPEESVDAVYDTRELPHVRKVNTLTGFVPRHLVDKQVPAFSDRPIDVAYRGRKLPEWLGELGQEKWRIAENFSRDALRYGLSCDISYREEDRLYGPAWIELLSRAKATLGVESGASVFDFTGDIERNVRAHLVRAPNADFDQLRQLYFASEEGRIPLNQVSPRVFEAAALRTLMILYEGKYSGVLIPWRHYVPLSKDHSNMQAVVEVLRDPGRAGEIIENAYREVALNPAYSFQAFVEKFDATLQDAFRVARGRGAFPYTNDEFAAAAQIPAPDRLRRMRRDLIDRVFRFVFGEMLAWLPARQRDRLKQLARRLYSMSRLRLRRS